MMSFDYGYETANGQHTLTMLYADGDTNVLYADGAMAKPITETEFMNMMYNRFCIISEYGLLMPIAVTMDGQYFSIRTGVAEAGDAGVFYTAGVLNE